MRGFAGVRGGAFCARSLFRVAAARSRTQPSAATRASGTARRAGDDLNDLSCVRSYLFARGARQADTAAPAAQVRSIAVLPFRTLGADELEWACRSKASALRRLARAASEFYNPAKTQTERQTGAPPR
jgi:hypothetical protein